MLIDKKQEYINIDEIRRQLGIAILTVFAIIAGVYNTISLSSGFASTTDSPSLVGYGVAVVCLVAVYMLRRRLHINIALHLPIILLLAIFIALPSEQSYSILIFSILVYSAIMTRLPIFVAISIFMLSWSVYQQSVSPEFAYMLFALVALPIGGIVFYVIHTFTSITITSERTQSLTSSKCQYRARN